MPWIIILVALSAVVALNLSEASRRARMTPEARAVEDAETLAEMQIW
jgi:hypothetical protein